MPKTFQPLDPFQSLADAHDRVLLQCRRGLVELRPVAPGVMRVRAGRRHRLPAAASLALTSPLPPPPAHQLKPAAAGARVSQLGLAVQIDFEPLRLAFARSAARPSGAPGGQALTVIDVGVQDQSTVVRASIAPGEHVYGLGEKTGWLDKRHRRYRMRTTDVLLVNREGIGIITDPLYASFPVFLVHGQAGSYGIFVDNTEYATFDFTRAGEPAGRYEFAVPAPILTFYLMAGPALPDVLRQYTDLTGRMPLPALWTMGYHQSRWGYRSEADFRAIAHELRERRIPADAMWFDIDYMDGYRVFTWDQQRFPQPARLLADLKAQGLRGVTIVDPGVKVDPAYKLYGEGRQAGHFIRHRDSQEYNGNVWPGLSALPDFHQASARDWWAGHVRQWLDETGLAGLWNDMNEPAVTDVSGPIEEVLHAGGTLPHPAARNTYALQMARATHAGLLSQAPDSRPFVLTRAAFSGAQTVTALWGGDNSPLWEHLAGSLPMLMNLGMSGMPFVGVDIGGFAGDTHAELLARWFQAGAFYPFCRNHAETGTNPHEPWAFGPEIEAICRRYLELRYRLLPYTYNLFRAAALTGSPIMRPLAWHYPTDEATFNLSDQFLFGPDLLVAPVVEPGVTARAVYLPRGDWYRWGLAGAAPARGPGSVLADAPLPELPLYVRGGAIVPMWPLAPHTGAIARAGLELHLWPGRGEIDYYEDDGLTQAYARGEYRLTPFRWRPNRGGYSLAWGPSTGAYRDARTRWTFVFHGLSGLKTNMDRKRIPARRIRGAIVVQIPDDGAKHSLELVMPG
jgi:alpha-glucosidase